MGAFKKPRGHSSGVAAGRPWLWERAISASPTLDKRVLTWFLEAVSSPAAGSPLPCPFLQQKAQRDCLCLARPDPDVLHLPQSNKRRPWGRLGPGRADGRARRSGLREDQAIPVEGPLLLFRRALSPATQSGMQAQNSLWGALSRCPLPRQARQPWAECPRHGYPREASVSSWLSWGRPELDR